MSPPPAPPQASGDLQPRAREGKKPELGPGREPAPEARLRQVTSQVTGHRVTGWALGMQLDQPCGWGEAGMSPWRAALRQRAPGSGVEPDGAWAEAAGVAEAQSGTGRPRCGGRAAAAGAAAAGRTQVGLAVEHLRAMRADLQARPGQGRKKEERWGGAWEDPAAAAMAATWVSRAAGRFSPEADPPERLIIKISFQPPPPGPPKL